MGYSAHDGVGHADTGDNGWYRAAFRQATAEDHKRRFRIQDQDVHEERENVAFRSSVFWKTVATDRDTCTDPDRCGIELDGSIGSGWRQDGKHRADSPVLADDTVIGTYRTDGEGS